MITSTAQEPGIRQTKEVIQASTQAAACGYFGKSSYLDALIATRNYVKENYNG
jgi:hypothetical protein